MFRRLANRMSAEGLFTFLEVPEKGFEGERLNSVTLITDGYV